LGRLNGERGEVVGQSTSPPSSSQPPTLPPHLPHMSTSKSRQKSSLISRTSAKKASSLRIRNASIRRRRTNFEAHVLLEKEYAAACDDLRDNPDKTFAEVARARGLTAYTLRRRFRGLTQAPRNAHAMQMLLSLTQERVVVDWAVERGKQGRPVSQLGIRAQIKELVGIRPSRQWVNSFTDRNPGLIFATASSLDPRRASCFNRTAIANHFTALRAALDMGIKLRNIYNMDEQGVQFGGSRNKLGKKYFFSRHERTRYRLRPGSLELITIIDAVCADGSKLEPGFIFQGGQTFEAGWFIPDRPYIT
jgi:hypothetical protein